MDEQDVSTSSFAGNSTWSDGGVCNGPIGPSFYTTSTPSEPFISRTAVAVAVTAYFLERISVNE